MSAWRFDGRLLVVTGGSRGIGAAIVSEALALGAQIIAVARQPAGLAELAGSLGHPQRLTTVAADVAHPAGRTAVLTAIANAGGVLHGLVLNHGITHRAPPSVTSIDDFERLLAINHHASVLLATACFPYLQAAGDAALVAVGSIAGRLALPDRIAYGASKAALEQSVRSLALAWGSAGIRANSVLPFFTRTPMVSGILEDHERSARITGATALGRIAEADEVARAALFLAMPASSYLTGHALVVDGGFSSSGLIGL